MTGTRAQADENAISPAIRRNLLISASALALCLSGPAFAQTSDAQPGTTGKAEDANAAPALAGDTAKDDDDIVVTGLRASLASAQAIKINSGQFVNSVTAVDIGKYPDLNVAEALQRILGNPDHPQSRRGIGDRHSRPDPVRTEVNGRDSFGASGARALGFEDVPSELLTRVDVYKSVGGTDRGRDRRAGEPAHPNAVRPEGLPAVGDGRRQLLRPGRPDQVQRLRPARAEEIQHQGVGEIGVLVDLSYFEGAFRSDEIVVEPYFERKDIPGSVGTTRLVPDGAGIGITFGDRRRKGAYAALQWKPAEDLEFYGQLFRTDYTIRTPNYTSFVTCGTDVNCATNQMQPTGTFQFDSDGRFVKGAFTGFGAVANNSQYHRNRGITTDYSAGLKWGATDHLKVNADFQYITPAPATGASPPSPRWTEGRSRSTCRANCPRSASALRRRSSTLPITTSSR